MKIRLKYGLFVDKKPSEVFDFLADPENMLKWQNSMFEIKAKTKMNARGKLQHGAKVHDRRNVLGVHIDAEWEVIDLDQDKRLALRVVQGNTPWETVYTLEPLEGGTFLVADGTGDLNVHISPAAAHRSCQSMFQRDLNTLADLLS